MSSFLALHIPVELQKGKCMQPASRCAGTYLPPVNSAAAYKWVNSHRKPQECWCCHALCCKKSPTPDIIWLVTMQPHMSCPIQTVPLACILICFLPMMSAARSCLQPNVTLTADPPFIGIAIYQLGSNRSLYPHQLCAGPAAGLPAGCLLHTLHGRPQHLGRRCL